MGSVPDESRTVVRDMDSKLAATPGITSAIAGGRLVSSALERLKVVIVEDDAVLRRALSRALRDWGAQVTEAESVTTALACLAQRPELVVLDVRLPDGSGIDVARAALRTHPVPLMVAMSGEASASEGFELAQVGVCGYLSKPLVFEDFMATLDAVLQSPPDLGPHLTPQVGRRPFQEIQAAVRRSMVEQALSLSGGNRTGAARLLKVSRQAVQQMIRDLDIA